MKGIDCHEQSSLVIGPGTLLLALRTPQKIPSFLPSFHPIQMSLSASKAPHVVRKRASFQGSPLRDLCSLDRTPFEAGKLRPDDFLPPLWLCFSHFHSSVLFPISNYPNSTFLARPSFTDLPPCKPCSTRSQPPPRKSFCLSCSSGAAPNPQFLLLSLGLSLRDLL